jgi:predicted nucleotidyltransferase
MNELSKNINQIQRLCDKHNVNTLFAFGSVLTDDFYADSDVDLVVDISSDDPLVYSDNYFGLKFQLEQIFNRQIDLLEQKAIKNPFLKQQINKTKVLLYGR